MTRDTQRAGVAAYGRAQGSSEGEEGVIPRGPANTHLGRVLSCYGERQRQRETGRQDDVAAALSTKALSTNRHVLLLLLLLSPVTH